ncbi:MAG: hypothetical protein LBI12_00105 [Treponema sp.]|nr:hypothetical protein [Treponema sp.]
MPWRLILIIVVFVVFLIFIAFNLDDNYKSDINFGFSKVEDVPVYLTILTSFVVGLLCALPFAMRVSKKINNTSGVSKKKHTEKTSDSGAPGKGEEKNH